MLKLLCSTAVACGAAAAGPAIAQSASVPPSDLPAPSAAQTSSSAPQPEPEIVITAQKRSERLQDVPMAVSAVPATTLLQRGQVQIQEYFATVPGVNLNSEGNGQFNVAIRGVTTGALTNPAVGVVIDDVPFGSSTALGYGSRLLPDLDPASLSRIEILRGPQGTLYGASSIGGLVKFVTLDPSTSDVSGRMQLDANDVSHGEFGFGLRGSVNIPISSNLAVRGGGFVRRDGGFVDNITTGEHDVNRVKYYGGNFAALWRPTDRMSVKLTALAQRTRGDGSAQVNADYRLKPTIGDLKQTYLRGTGDYDIDVNLLSGIVNYDFGPATLTSVTGYGVNKYHSPIDASNTFGGLANLVYGVSGVALLNQFKTKKFSQEVRLASSNQSKLEWLIGGFYTKEKTPAEQDLFAIDPATGAKAGDLLISVFPTTFREVAGFADATYHFTPQFDVQVGARYSANKQTYREFDSGPLVSGEVAANSKDHAFTYLVTPRYKFSRDLMAYIRVASGYRPGGPNPSADLLGFPSSYGPDRTTEYEAGLKGSLADHLITYDLAAYWIDWKDIQLTLRDPATGFAYFANAAKARSRGLEASVQSNPAQGLSIEANASINDAELREDLPAGASFGLSGDRLPNAAKFSGSLSVDQKFFVGNGAQAFVGGSLTHLGKRRGDFAPTPADIRVTYPAFTTLDLRAGVDYNDWVLTLYARNITDKRGVIGGGPNNLRGVATTTSPYYVTYIRPRTIGVSIAKGF
jgi:outer membrane receptor protein involved in Fe transport